MFEDFDEALQQLETVRARIKTDPLVRPQFEAWLWRWSPAAWQLYRVQGLTGLDVSCWTFLPEFASYLAKHEQQDAQTSPITVCPLSAAAEEQIPLDQRRRQEERDQQWQQQNRERP